MTNCAYHPEHDAVGACVNCGKLICEECKKTIGEKIYCNPCSKSVVENTSGQGKTAVVPDEVKGWNWGAFLLGVIWGIGNNVWIALLEFIPFLGFIIPFVLGEKGNEWAWRNKKWDSVEHFKRTQRAWTKWGVWLIVVLPILFTLAAVIIPNVGKFIDKDESEAYEAELHNVQTAVLAMLVDSTAGQLDAAVTTTDDMTTVTADNGTKSLDEYLIGLDAPGKIPSGCTYAFTVDGKVTQTLPP